MVETLEHAIYLHKLLPEYAVVHCGANKKKTIGGVSTFKYKMDDKRLDYLRRQFSKGELKKVIATTTWREGVDFPNLAVLIRADGMTSPIAGNQIPGRLSRLAEGKNCGVLVDFGDEFSSWAERRSKERMGVYRKTGWRILNRNIV